MVKRKKKLCCKTSEYVSMYVCRHPYCDVYHYHNVTEFKTSSHYVSLSFITSGIIFGNQASVIIFIGNKNNKLCPYTMAINNSSLKKYILLSSWKNRVFRRDIKA